MVAEVRRGAKGVALLLEVKAQVPIVSLAKSGWLASVNVLCACFGIKESATWRTASTSICAAWLLMASPAWVIIVLMSTRPPLIEGARRIFRRFLRAVIAWPPDSGFSYYVCFIDYAISSCLTRSDSG